MHRLELACAIMIALAIGCGTLELEEGEGPADAAVDTQREASTESPDDPAATDEAAPVVRRSLQALTPADIAAGRVYEISASLSPPGSGTVSVTSPSVATDARCAANVCAVSPRARVVLQATATGTNRFVRWNNCGGGTSSRLVIAPPTATVVCEAVFMDTRVLATDGMGYVSEGGYVVATTSAPNSSCTGARCVTPVGATVRVEARTNTGYLFLGWSSCSRSSDSAINVVASTHTEFCVANFTPIYVRFGGVGTTPRGRINAAIGGTALTCPSGACDVLLGSTVTVDAVAAPAYTFRGWSQCASGTTNPLTLPPLSRHETCRAEFDLTGPLVTFAAYPPAAGTVSARAIGSGTCSASSCTIPERGSVQITASHVGGFRLVGWSCRTSAGDSTTITLTDVTSQQNCVAFFGTAIY